MSYTARNYDHLLGVEGFSEKLLKDHFTLYSGYVTAVNKLLERFAEASCGNPERAELRRRFGWEFNGMRLHELYFNGMSAKKGAGPTGDLKRKIEADFKSFEAWQTDFLSVGAMRGIGWAVLCFDPESNRLLNVWIDQHDSGHLAGAVPILVMDVFEHAYMTDYGLRRADYIQAFLKAVDWSAAARRFAAPSANILS